MTKSKLALALAIAFVGAAAHAQTVVSDTDGNGVFSIEEMKAAYPDMTLDLFNQIDQDGSGSVDADELQAAREAGLISN